MSTTSVHRRVARSVAVLAAAGLLLGAGQASASPAQAAEPVVTISATPGSAVSATDCKGAHRTTSRVPIMLTVSRTGDTTTPLTVSLTYGGSLAAASGLPSQATIGAGAVDVGLAANDLPSGSLEIAVTDGPDYAVGAPGQLTTYVGAMVADLGCNIGNPVAEQTIEVGTTPATVDVVKVAYGPPESLERSIVGTVPPGTTFHLDGTWDGVATEVGDYRFREYFCEADGWCPYRADLRVIVVPAGTDPGDPDDPEAPPVAAPAQAAAPVAGSPSLTG